MSVCPPCTHTRVSLLNVAVSICTKPSCSYCRPHLSLDHRDHPVSPPPTSHHPLTPAFGSSTRVGQHQNGLLYPRGTTLLSGGRGPAHYRGLPPPSPAHSKSGRGPRLAPPLQRGGGPGEHFVPLCCRCVSPAGCVPSWDPFNLFPFTHRDLTRCIIFDQFYSHEKIY